MPSSSQTCFRTTPKPSRKITEKAAQAMPLPIIDPARYEDELAAKLARYRADFAEFDLPTRQDHRAEERHEQDHARDLETRGEARDEIDADLPGDTRFPEWRDGAFAEESRDARHSAGPPACGYAFVTYQRLR